LIAVFGKKCCGEVFWEARKIFTGPEVELDKKE
jgi:hypothetical protein